MSFKDTIKSQLTINLQTKQEQKLIVDNLQTEIIRCIGEIKIPIYATMNYNLDWSDDEVNMLKMLIKSNVGVCCDVNDGKIWCPLSSFL
jgi:hypothetical protein